MLGILGQNDPFADDAQHERILAKLEWAQK